MNLAVEHPLVFLGLCGICVLNAYIVWRIDHPRRRPDNVVPLFPEATDV